MASAMYTCGKFDILYNEQPEHRKSNYMDLTHASGYGLLIYSHGTFCSPNPGLDSLVKK